MVYILLGEGFEEAEALVTADVLRRGGVEAALTGIGGMTVSGAHKIAVCCDTAAESVSLAEGDMLVLPGGLGGVEAIQKNHFAQGLIQKAWDKGCWLAAICAAPTILAHAGLLDRRKAVCYPGMEEQMGSAVVQPGQRVVTDGRIVTGEGPGSSFDFGLKLVEALLGAAEAEKVRHAVHYR